jgi:hypothetical protein
MRLGEGVCCECGRPFHDVLVVASDCCLCLPCLIKGADMLRASILERDYADYRGE